MAVLNFFPVQKLIFGHFWNCKKWKLVKKNFVKLIPLISRVFFFFGLDYFKFSGPLCYDKLSVSLFVSSRYIKFRLIFLLSKKPANTGSSITPINYFSLYLLIELKTGYQKSALSFVQNLLVNLTNSKLSTTCLNITISTLTLISLSERIPNWILWNPFTIILDRKNQKKTPKIPNWNLFQIIELKNQKKTPISKGEQKNWNVDLT